MEYLQILLLSVFSVIFLFILSKLMGFRAISELSFFDYVVSITIGSIAAEMATNIDLEWWKSVIAMAVYAVFAIVLAFFSQKSNKARKTISGTPIILINKGKIDKRSLRKARIELNDLLTSARVAGYFDLADIDYAIMETTGKISFLPVPLARPLNPKDFNFAPEECGLYVNVVMDGKIMENDLINAGIDKKELLRRIRMENKSIEKIMLATINSKGELTIYDR